MVARKRSLAWLARSSSMFFSRNVCSICLRSVTSRMAAVTSRPSSVWRGERLISTGNSLPSLRTPYSESPAPMGRTRASRKNPLRCPACAPWKRSGTSTSMARPISSSRAQPKRRSVWELTSTMMPRSSTATMASGAASRSPRNFASAAVSRDRSAISRNPITRPSASRRGVTTRRAVKRVSSRCSRCTVPCHAPCRRAASSISLVSASDGGAVPSTSSAS